MTTALGAGGRLRPIICPDYVRPSPQRGSPRNSIAGIV